MSIICHDDMSLITCDMSWITSDMSLITSDMSLITCNIYLWCHEKTIWGIEGTGLFQVWMNCWFGLSSLLLSPSLLFLLSSYPPPFLSSFPSPPAPSARQSPLSTSLLSSVHLRSLSLLLLSLSSSSGEASVSRRVWAAEGELDVRFVLAGETVSQWEEGAQQPTSWAAYGSCSGTS